MLPYNVCGLWVWIRQKGRLRGTSMDDHIKYKWRYTIVVCTFWKKWLRSFATTTVTKMTTQILSTQFLILQFLFMRVGEGPPSVFLHPALCFWFVSSNCLRLWVCSHPLVTCGVAYYHNTLKNTACSLFILTISERGRYPPSSECTWSASHRPWRGRPGRRQDPKSKS